MAAGILLIDPGSRQVWFAALGVLIISTGVVVIRMAVAPDERDLWSQQQPDH